MHAEDGRNQVEAGDAHQSPVQASHYQQYCRCHVQCFHFVLRIFYLISLNFALAPVCARDVLTVMHNYYLTVKTYGNAKVVCLAVKKDLLYFGQRKGSMLR
jgi:hypothetical protein